MSRLGLTRVGQPLRQRLVIVAGEPGRVDPRTGTAGGGQRERRDDAGTPTPGATDVQADALPATGMVGQPLGNLAGPQDARAHLETLVGLGFDRGQRRVQPLPQRPELQGVEELVDGFAVPRAQPKIDGGDVQRHVPGELGQGPVADHAGQMGAQRRTRLPAEFVHPVDELGQRPELLDPLRGGLLPHPGHRRQVVRGVTAQRGEVRVLHRGETVLRLDLRRREPGHVTDAAPGHQHRHLVGDELQRVPVTGDDQHLHPHGRALARQCRDDVVRLVAGRADPEHGERVAHLLDQD